mmetsp:Transcript_13048/g.30346  ORF Transcript_13048/g.30346 Transcript_13048/m.30346 type:complete len:223 (+) Transcript_13048:396-1064(+)
MKRIAIVVVVICQPTMCKCGVGDSNIFFVVWRIHIDATWDWRYTFLFPSFSFSFCFYFAIPSSQPLGYRSRLFRCHSLQTTNILDRCKKLIVMHSTLMNRFRGPDPDDERVRRDAGETGLRDVRANLGVVGDNHIACQPICIHTTSGNIPIGCQVLGRENHLDTLTMLENGGTILVLPSVRVVYIVAYMILSLGTVKHHFHIPVTYFIVAPQRTDQNGSCRF